MVASLIRQGADVNRCSTYLDLTPLHYAAYFGCAKVVAVVICLLRKRR